VTDVKIEGKIGGQAADAIEPHARDIYNQPGCRIIGIVELAHVERTEPAPDSDKSPSVKLRISALEIPAREQAGALREAMRALHLHRTAAGTLTDDGDIELSQQTMRQTAGLLSELENARLRAGLQHWTDYARSVATTVKPLSASELRHELQTVVDGLQGLLDRAAVERE